MQNFNNNYPNYAVGSSGIQNPNGYPANQVVPNWMNQNGYTPNNSQESVFNNVMVVPVNGYESASNYPVAMGTTVLLMDYNNKVFWLKSNDGVSTKMVKHEFTAETQENPNPNTEFVTKKEFDEFKKFIKNSGKNMKGNRNRNEQQSDS